MLHVDALLGSKQVWKLCFMPKNIQLFGDARSELAEGLLQQYK